MSIQQGTLYSNDLTKTLFKETEKTLNNLQDEKW